MLTRKDIYPIPDPTAFVLDEHLLFAESFTSLLKSKNLFQHVFQSNQENAMWEMLQSQAITHLFIDHSFAGTNITGMLIRIQAACPDMQIIVVCSTSNTFLIRHMLTSVAKAVISKQACAKEIDTCLQALRSGRKYIAADIRELVRDHTGLYQPTRFTNREIHVLQYIANGYTITETATALCLSRHTVIAHRRSLMNKSGHKTATGLVKFAFETGLINR